VTLKNKLEAHNHRLHQSSFRCSTHRMASEL